MKKNAAILAIFSLLIAVALLLVMLAVPSEAPRWLHLEKATSSLPDSESDVAGIPELAEPNSKDSLATDASGLAHPASSKVKEELRRILTQIRSGASPQEIRKSLRDAQKTVHAAPIDVAAESIIALLQTGEDAATGLGFVVGAEGVLDETPTWRTALLDLLGQTDPFQFVAHARAVVASTTSPDEYALALRNLGWANSTGQLDVEIRDYFLAMLSRPEWRQNPSTGYLEAFDLAVTVGEVSGVAAELDQALGSDESPISRAAFVALDRIMLTKPAMVIAQFDNNPDFLARSPYHRASIIARLDVRKPEQSALLAQYLLRSDHASGEMEYFSELFPNGNRFASHRLVTNPELGGSIEDMNMLDRATVDALSAWMDQPEFADRRKELSKMIARLKDLSGMNAQ